jgi:hypothetical protein
MRHTCRKVLRNTVASLMIIFFLLALAAEFSSGQTRQTRSAENPLVKLGQLAPDFELPKLTLKTDETGKPIGVISEKDTVRLSSFRGKKPVCLIMSSYT